MEIEFLIEAIKDHPDISKAIAHHEIIPRKDAKFLDTSS